MSPLPTFLPLLGDLSQVPPDYIKGCAQIKRFLERWTMDPSFREFHKSEPEAAIASLGLDLTPEEVFPFVDDDAARALSRALKAGEADGYPVSVLRYRAFYAEKRKHRASHRADGRSSNARYATWRVRQMNRVVGQLGTRKADALVHAPGAIELARGCSVGCWFCGVGAQKLSAAWEYTPETASIWKWTLETFRGVIGDCAKQCFLYWATDPLDNPDYEHFLRDFHATLGRCPQTTTAMGVKNPERTRKLLRLAHSMDSAIDRFSTLTLKMLAKIHASFTPEELIRVECIPQNKEANDRYRKANAGRARSFKDKQGRVMPEEESSTIACVSGFLFNMVDRTVRLVSPCNASPRWPLGYWVFEEGHFDTPEELQALLEGMVDRHMITTVHPERVIKLRRDLKVDDLDDGGICMRSYWLKITYANRPEMHHLGRRLAAGTFTAEEIALERERDFGIPLTDTFLVLQDMFDKGLFDEEPVPREVPAQMEQLEPVLV